MRKITLVLVLTFLLNSVLFAVPSQAAYDSFDELGALGILNADIANRAQNTENVLTRGEAIFILSHLYADMNIEPCVTDFNDVSKEHKYSGYIKYLNDLGVVGGVGDGSFLPDAPIKAEHLYILAVKYLGYEPIAKTLGYNKIISMFGFDRNVKVNSDETVSVGAGLTFFENLIFNEYSDLAYSETADDITAYIVDKTQKTVLGSKLGITVFTGFVEEANYVKNTLSISVQKNKYETNYKKMETGETILVTAAADVDVYGLEFLPVTVWLNKEGEAILVEPQKNTEVKYAYISAVNDDMNTDHSYAISYVNEIMLVNDETEYDVSENATLKYNEVLTQSAQKLTGKFAKIVIVNDEITHIETWEFSEGGIITKFNTGSLMYTTGERKNVTFTDFEGFTKRLYFGSGRRLDESEVKTDSVFYYYKNGSSIVLLLSEYVITDEFKGIKEDKLVFGNFEYRYDKNNLYTSTDGEKYKKNEDLFNYLGLYMKAYLAPDDSILYMTPSVEGSAMKTEFYAAVCGMNKDAFGLSDEMKLYVVDANPYEKVFKITDKTLYEGTLFANNTSAIEEIGKTINDLQGKNIYKFIVNTKDEIVEINKKEAFYGYNTDSVKVTYSGSLPQFGTECVYYNSERLYFKGQPITMIFEVDGKMTMKQAKWSDIYSKSVGTGGVSMEFFGEYMESIPDLIILYGNKPGAVEAIGSGGYYGVVRSNGLTLAENGEERYLYEGSNGQKLYVDSEMAVALGEYALVRARTVLPFSDESTYVNSYTNLSKGPQNWESLGMTKGVVEKFDGIRLYTQDGKARFVGSDGILYYSYDESRRIKFQNDIAAQDIACGDTVYWLDDADGMRVLIVVR